MDGSAASQGTKRTRNASTAGSAITRVMAAATPSTATAHPPRSLPSPEAETASSTGFARRARATTTAKAVRSEARHGCCTCVVFSAATWATTFCLLSVTGVLLDPIVAAERRVGRGPVGPVGGDPEEALDLHRGRLRGGAEAAVERDPEDVLPELHLRAHVAEGERPGAVGDHGAAPRARAHVGVAREAPALLDADRGPLGRRAEALVHQDVRTAVAADRLPVPDPRAGRPAA